MGRIEQNVRTVLSTLEIDNNEVRISEQLDRKLYLAVNKVLERLGGKWNRKAKAHIFDADPVDRINWAIESGTLDPVTKTGYFFTPLGVVDVMIRLAKLGSNQSILEPSAGQGHIADRILAKTDQLPADICICETLPENIRILEEKGYVVNGDFFAFSDECKKHDILFDRIVMNPPFERQADINHVLKAYELLNHGGILVTIMSAGVTFRKNKKTTMFWGHLRSQCTHLVHLPDDAFKESGTSVHTIVLRLEKQ